MPESPPPVLVRDRAHRQSSQPGPSIPYTPSERNPVITPRSTEGRRRDKSGSSTRTASRAASHISASQTPGTLIPSAVVLPGTVAPVPMLPFPEGIPYLSPSQAVSQRVQATMSTAPLSPPPALHYAGGPSSPGVPVLLAPQPQYLTGPMSQEMANPRSPSGSRRARSSSSRVSHRQ